MNKSMQKHEKQDLETGYATITVDEILLFLYGLKPDEYIDSRILFQFMQSPLVECEIQHQHSDWLTFAFEATELDILPFCLLNAQTNTQGNEFLLLESQQACFLALYAQYPHLNFVQKVKTAFNTFLQENKGRKLIDGWLAAIYLVSKINKTVEELQAELPQQTRKQKEKQIENALSSQLKQSNIEVKQQVKCSGGIADIVTPEAIYEIKAELTFQVLRHAIAQVLAYRHYINPTAKAYVVGRKPVKEEIAYQIADPLGVEIIVWED